MGYSKDQLIARLKELQIDFGLYEHPAVLTVDEQAKYVGHLDGALSKNLFLKDKKHRYYVVSALEGTKVDMKILSQRLGLGKGGLRFAPEEALAEILQVPLGCVTPFALLNESARDVSLLLDQGLRTKECCFFHPLSNDVTISLNTRGLDKFLNSIGKPPTYVDLEANPPVGKDQPPDLADLVPSDVTTLSDKLEVVSVDTEKKNRVSADVKSEVKAKTEKASKSSKKQNASMESQTTFADPGKFVQEILEQMSHVVLSEVRRILPLYVNVIRWFNGPSDE
ncbi:OLC1v1005064C1 [Oldenlandia corymbosa var. corymbosa]|uniref:OLC1v1005064C1 n=1 Tax=Oldenlandia corymbosa var. corymbosa TaxID=529605 RepID=A0AAV1DDS8_OLDCO|nr:OLC1v1005064C1 [Oldenlandia corymbosa var. corymbosa]